MLNLLPCEDCIVNDEQAPAVWKSSTLSCVRGLSWDADRAERAQRAGVGKRGTPGSITQVAVSRMREEMRVHTVIRTWLEVCALAQYWKAQAWQHQR